MAQRNPWRVMKVVDSYVAVHERVGHGVTFDRRFTTKGAASAYVRQRGREEHAGYVPARLPGMRAPTQRSLFNPHRRAPRRNIDAFIDSVGVVHPIRGSSGYSAQVERATKRSVMARRTRSSASLRHRASSTPAQGHRRSTKGEAKALNKRLGISTRASRRAATDRALTAGSSGPPKLPPRLSARARATMLREAGGDYGHIPGFNPGKTPKRDAKGRFVKTRRR